VQWLKSYSYLLGNEIRRIVVQGQPRFKKMVPEVPSQSITELGGTYLLSQLGVEAHTCYLS
jgi:hypothetical protein